VKQIVRMWTEFKWLRIVHSGVYGIESSGCFTRELSLFPKRCHPISQNKKMCYIYYYITPLYAFKGPAKPFKSILSAQTKRENFHSLHNLQCSFNQQVTHFMEGKSVFKQYLPFKWSWFWRKTFKLCQWNSFTFGPSLCILERIWFWKLPYFQMT